MRSDCTLISVPNKAFGCDTWTNDRRQSWKQWRYGHSSLATDGSDSADLADCAIMDNYYVEVPVFRVDLGEARRVRGVVVVTWQGKGQGESGRRRVRQAFLLLPRNQFVGSFSLSLSFFLCNLHNKNTFFIVCWLGEEEEEEDAITGCGAGPRATSLPNPSSLQPPKLILSSVVQRAGFAGGIFTTLVSLLLLIAGPCV